MLAGIIADYKEADKVPAELRSSLENIWEEAKFLNREKKEFDLVRLRKRLRDVVQKFYIRQFIRVLEKPFRQGDGTMDDVSIFLLREFERKLV